MPSRSPRRIALFGATAAILAGVLVTPAGAADRLDFELTPVGGGSYPRFNARPGQTVTGALRLHSRTRRAQVIRLEALDLTTATTGGVEFGREPARATGTWVRLSRRDVRLPARGSRIVRFRAHVPRHASAGEHFGGIAASDRAEVRPARSGRSSGGVQLREITRVALPVRFRVPGAAAAALELRGVAFAANAAGSRLDLNLRSVGRRLVRETTVDLRVTGAGGREVLRHRSSLSEFVPKTAIRYPMAWRGRPARGTYRVTGAIRPRGAPAIRVDERVSFGDRQASRLEGRTGRSGPRDGPPILLLAALGVALILAAAALAAYIRLRRRVARLLPME